MEDEDDGCGAMLIGTVLFGAVIWFLAGYGLYALTIGWCR